MANRRSPDFKGKVESVQDNISSFFSPPDPTDAPSAPSETSQTDQPASTTNSPSKTAKASSSNTPSNTRSSSQSTPSSASSSPSPTSSSSLSSSSKVSSSSTSASSSSSSTSLSSSSSSSLSSSLTSSSTTLTSSTSTHASSTSALPAATTIPPATAKSSGSDGTKIALGVFGGFIALSLLLLATYWIRRSKQNRRKAEQQRRIDEMPMGDYQKMRDSQSDIHDSPVFKDERDPDIRRQRLGAADTIPMTDAGAWGSQHYPQTQSHYEAPLADTGALPPARKNSFDSGPNADQLNRALPPVPRKAVATPAPTPPPQPYVAYKPFSQSYQPPAILVAGLQARNGSPATRSQQAAGGISNTGRARRPRPENEVHELPSQ